MVLPKYLGCILGPNSHEDIGPRSIPFPLTGPGQSYIRVLSEILLAEPQTLIVHMGVGLESAFHAGSDTTETGKSGTGSWPPCANASLHQTQVLFWSSHKM